MQNEKTIRLLVSGLVQGVGFRWATRRVAIKLKIAGFVQNLNNGQVKIVAQGSPTQLKRFYQRIAASPTPYGHVERIQTKTIHRIPYSLFVVR